MLLRRHIVVGVAVIVLSVIVGGSLFLVTKNVGPIRIGGNNLKGS